MFTRLVNREKGPAAIDKMALEMALPLYQQEGRYRPGDPLDEL